MTTKGTRVRLVSIIAMALAMATMTGCGSSDGVKVPSDQALQPAKGDSAWSTKDVRGVTISVPSDWKKIGPLPVGEDGEQYAFQTDENSFGTRGGAQLLTLDKRNQSAEKMVIALRDEAVAVAGAKQISTKAVKWPGATSAWYLTYVAYPPNKGKTAPHPTEVLVVDFEGGGQAQATVTALEEDFAPQKLHTILGTVKVTDSAGATTS